MVLATFCVNAEATKLGGLLLALYSARTPSSKACLENNMFACGGAGGAQVATKWHVTRCTFCSRPARRYHRVFRRGRSRSRRANCQKKSQLPRSPHRRDRRVRIFTYWKGLLCSTMRYPMGYPMGSRIGVPHGVPHGVPLCGAPWATPWGIPWDTPCNV